jgi:hypothetical protein
MKRIKEAEEGNNFKANSTKMSSSSNNNAESSSPDKAESSSFHTPQIFRHSLLLMLMCCSMVAGNLSTKILRFYLNSKCPRIDHTLMASICESSGN